MRTELSKLHDRLQTTMIYVTHDQTEAMTMGDRIVVLKDGVIQQVDDPLTLYNKPENMFVAGFIGSPAMNFMDATIKKEGDIYYIDGNGTFKIRVPEDKEKFITDYDGKEVVFGVRPEDIIDTEITHDFEVKADNSFKAEVEVVEPMGSEIYLYLAENGHSLIARVEAESTAKVGDTIELGVDLRKIHLFDAENEESIF
jgi:multiple sugar transport system ATP-binding protein